MSKPLPRQLQRQLAEAEELQAQISRKPETLQVSPVELEAEPVPEAEPTKPEPVKPATPPKDDPAKWEQRYRSLQGEFNKLVPDLQQQVAALKADLEETQRQAKAQRAEPQKLTTDKDVEEFGADMMDVIERKAREIAQERESALLDRLDAVENELRNAKQQLGDVATTTAATIEDRFWARLESLVPDWKEVNTNQDFLNWLEGEDDLTGIRRQDLLTEHGKKFNADRVAAVFRAYKGQAPVAPQTQTDPDDSLEGQVSPSRTTAAPRPNTQRPQGRVFTGSEIQRFYDPRSRKLYTPEQYQALEVEINRAISEGRVVP